MTNSAPHVSPQEVLAAGSLVEVPVSIEQAEAVSSRADTYASPGSGHLALHSWLIPDAGSRLTSAAIETGELEVHFLYIPDQPFDLSRPTTGLEVIVYDRHGVELTRQDYGVNSDA